VDKALITRTDASESQVLLKCATHWWNGFNSRTTGLVGGQVVTQVG